MSGTINADRSAATHPDQLRPPHRWPKALRRGPMEWLATIVIAAGVVMLMQPWSLSLYGWSFATTLVGTAMFIVVSKFPT